MKSKKQGVTRSGYRYDIVSANEIVTDPETWGATMCQGPNCWALIQGGDAAMAEHQRVVHGGVTWTEDWTKN